MLIHQRKIRVNELVGTTNETIRKMEVNSNFFDYFRFKKGKIKKLIVNLVMKKRKMGSTKLC